MVADARTTEPSAAARPAPWGPFVVLRFVGTGELVSLSTARDEFTFGAADCDVSSATAWGTLRRLPDTAALSVREAGVAGERVVRIGELFRLGDALVMAVDASLEGLRKSLAWSLGLDRHDRIDAAIEIIAEARPIALLAPSGSDARGLAAAIHRASPQREGAFVSVEASPLPSLRDCYGATVCVDLRTVGTFSAPFARRLLDERRRNLRAIFISHDLRQLRAHIDAYAERVRTVTLPPLAERGDEIARLLAMLWRESGSARDVGELGPSVANLARYRWPRNFDELREHAPRLLAYLEHGRLRLAAQALRIKHQSLAGHFRRIGIQVAQGAATKAAR